MYHIHRKGTHYEMGFTFGKRLQKLEIHILDNVPFEISEERIEFAKQCLPIYVQYFPNVLEEIRGLSEGNECSYEELCGVLLSMYCIMPESIHCSCMALRNGNGVYFARNSDFLVSIEKMNMNAIYKFTNASYDFNGNTTAFIEMEDGVNEHGLVIGLTSIIPKSIKAGFNAGMLLRLILETCKSVDEVIALVKSAPIASSQTFTLIDRLGNISCIECSSTKVEVYTPVEKRAFVCATNRFHFLTMQSEVVEVEDDWFAKERYQTMRKALQSNLAQIDINMVKNIMAGKYGFLCQYNRKSGKDTVWSIVYDVKQKKLYRCEGNPSRKKYCEDNRFRV